MREFFKGWRRKVGCALLVIACTLMVDWIRSFFVVDAIWFVGTQQNRIFVCNGYAVWQSYPAAGGGGGSNMRSADNSDPLFDALVQGMDAREITATWILPHWSIAMPLTLLSAYLLLWKPRLKARPDA